MAAVSASTSTQSFVVPALSQDEEDQIILARITLDERPLRRIIKKFHNYTSLSHVPIVPVVANGPVDPRAIEDAREAFLLELSSFELMIKKSVMVCEAEARQVGQYQLERHRLDNEHETLRAQIEELKTALEHAQMSRKRKIEYDLVAEKVNTLPSREELESAIAALENDMAAIRTEHETQNKLIQNQKSALDGIIADLSSLRVIGKEPEAETTPLPQSLRGTPAPDGTPAFPDAEVASVPDSNLNAQEGSDDKNASREGTSEGAVGDDIEMGEVEEGPKEKNKKKLREELEEGEATDASSELSEPPDD